MVGAFVFLFCRSSKTLSWIHNTQFEIFKPFVDENLDDFVSQVMKVKHPAPQNMIVPDQQKGLLVQKSGH